MNLNDLPDELLLEIFSSLSLNSFTDVLNLGLTCKRWYRILWSKQYLNKISSFKYQSRFLIYNCLSKDNFNEEFLKQFIVHDPISQTSFLTVDGNVSLLKQDIQNCSLVNTTISIWCRTRNRTFPSGTILLLWHFHLGYLGFYQDSSTAGNALIKCTYTKQYLLETRFAMKSNEWYHIAIVVQEKETIKLYINGNKISEWLLEEKLNKENLSVARYSSVWLGSHCGRDQWHGSIFDICLWKRCLQPYEIKEIARIRRTIDNVNFSPDLKLENSSNII